MSSLYIDFGYDDNVKRSVRKAKSAIDSRISDYKGIKNSLNNVSTNTSNLWNANSYIQKKYNQLQDKSDKLDAFHTKITNFNDCAYKADKKVADRINKETHAFYKREGIPHGFLYTIGSAICDGAEWLKGKVEELIQKVVNWCKSAWETVKNFYEENKYWIDVVVDGIKTVAAVVGTIAAVAALVAGTATGITAVLAVVFGVWGVAKSGTDLVYDSLAWDAHSKGDYELYEELSNTGLEKIMSENIPGGKYLYHGMEFANAVFDITQIGSTLINGKSKDGLFKAIGIKSFKDSKGNLLSFKSLKFADALFGNLKFAVSIPHNFLNYDFQKALVKSFKLGDASYKMLTSGEIIGIDLDRLIFKPLIFPRAPIDFALWREVV